MALKLIYYGQNDSVNCTPDVTLVGDPGVDQPVLTASGYLGGKIMAVSTLGALVSRGTNSSGNQAATSPVIVPCDVTTAPGNVPFATLLNGPGEFAGAIGPSGSKKAPVVRAMWQGNVTSEAYDSQSAASTGANYFNIGAYLYCGGSTPVNGTTNVGKYTSYYYRGVAAATAVGICTHVPTTAEPWLGVASLL
jgi:hypothetical protein